MRTLAALMGSLLILFGQALPAAADAEAPAAPEVTDTSFVTADGGRTLQLSMVIDAPVAVLWKAFTTSDEFRRWNAPVAAIDLRVGGSLEASYDAARGLGDPDNIKHRIITFLPERMLVFQNIQAPRNLPHADRFQRTVTILEYQPLAASQTRITLSSTGWADDPESRALYAFFKTGNADLLRMMEKTYGKRHGG